MDPQTAAEQCVVALLVRLAEQVRLVEEVLAQRLGVVGPLRRSGRDRLHPLGNDEVVGDLGRLELGEQLVVDESVEHLREPGPAALQVVDRVVARRRAHQPGEERRLDERQLGDLLAEVDLGRGRDAVGVVAEEDGVEVALEDLLLRLLLLEPHRVDHLQQLVAAVAFEAGQEVVLDDLHRDRRSALLRCVGREVRQRRPEQAAHVDALVHPELVVLDGQERLDDVGRHLVERDRLAVLELVDRDLVALGVVHVGALGERLEVGQVGRYLLVGVGDPPQSRRHGDDDGRGEKCSCSDDQRQTEDPADATHSANEPTEGPPGQDGRRSVPAAAGRAAGGQPNRRPFSTTTMPSSLTV